MAPLQPALVFPWVASADETPEQEEARLTDAVRRNLHIEYHQCGTAAMMSLAIGVAMDTNLLLYRTENVKVVDAGIMPLIPSVHLLLVSMCD